MLDPLMGYCRRWIVSGMRSNGSFGSVEVLRGVKVFERDTLYLLKPLSRRFWTKTAALNDADDIAATILSHPSRGKR